MGEEILFSVPIDTEDVSYSFYTSMWAAEAPVQNDWTRDQADDIDHHFGGISCQLKIEQFTTEGVFESSEIGMSADFMVHLKSVQNCGGEKATITLANAEGVHTGFLDLTAEEVKQALKGVITVTVNSEENIKGSYYGKLKFYDTEFQSETKFKQTDSYEYTPNCRLEIKEFSHIESDVTRKQEDVHITLHVFLANSGYCVDSMATLDLFTPQDSVFFTRLDADDINKALSPEGYQLTVIMPADVEHYGAHVFYDDSNAESVEAGVDNVYQFVEIEECFIEIEDFCLLDVASNQNGTSTVGASRWDFLFTLTVHATSWCTQVETSLDIIHEGVYLDTIHLD